MISHGSHLKDFALLYSVMGQLIGIVSGASEYWSLYLCIGIGPQQLSHIPIL